MNENQYSVLNQRLVDLQNDNNRLLSLLKKEIAAKAKAQAVAERFKRKLLKMELKSV